MTPHRLNLQGRIAVSGTPEAIVEDQEARRIYLGEGFRLQRN